MQGKNEAARPHPRGARGGDTMRKALKGALIVLLLLGLAVPLAAQSTVSGSVQGTVRDAQGAVLPGVAVTATSDALIAGKMTAYTDARGVYRFPSLPPGMYAIEAQLAGFVTQRAENVRVNATRGLAVDITLPQSKVTEAVTVSAEAPVVSVVSNTVGSNFDTGFLERQPLPRNFYSLLAAAPGVTVDVTGNGAAMMAYGGTGATQNSYTVDGVNVAEPGSGTYWLLPSIEWMQEIQIGGLGANAEYGGYTGGIINGVTKSGGNEFHGAVEAYYQPDSWVSNNTPEDLGPQAPFRFHDYAISLGGPVMRDKLWFFVSGEDWEQDTSPPGAERSTDRKIPRYLGKLTFQGNADNRLSLMLEHDTVNQDYRGISSTTLPEAAYKESAPNYTFAASWESLLNANNFVSFKVTGFDGREDDLPYHGFNTPGRQDYWNTGISWQNLDDYLLSHQHQVTFDASWSLFADGLFTAKDSHSFKFGGGYQDASVGYNSAPNGGYTLYDDSSGCPGDTPEEQFAYYMQHPECGVNDYAFKETGYGEYHERLQFKQIDLYAQDSMRLNRFTLNYGLRYGNLKGGFEPGTGNTDVYSTSFVDPRIGFVWDVYGNSKTALKMHIGRYHDKLKGYLYDREISGHIAPPVIDCYWDSATGQYDLDSNGDPGCETYSVPPAATMGNYGGQYVDEALLTVEQQVGKDVVVGLDLIDRRFRDIMAMINVNEDYTLVTATNNPLTGGTLPVWILNSPQVYVLTTDNGAYRDYKSVMLRLDKHYSHGWYLNSSVVWTDLKGNEVSNYGYESAYMDRNGFTNADGRMDWVYNKWDVKVNAAVDLPFDLQLSGQYNYLSGMYWTPYVRVTSGLGYNSTTGRDILLLPRGSYKFPARHLINLRLAWNPKLAGALRLTVSGEVFNVLNNSTMLDTYQRWGSYNANRNTWSGPRSSYDTPYSIEAPRQLRLGVRLEF
jgi:hypothetical protein